MIFLLDYNRTSYVFLRMNQSWGAKLMEHYQGQLPILSCPEVKRLIESASGHPLHAG